MPRHTSLLLTALALAAAAGAHAIKEHPQAVAASAMRPAAAAAAAAAAANDAAAAADDPAAAAASPFAHKVERLLRSLTLEEKLSQLNTDSPAVRRNGSTLIPAFNWWSECLHGAAVSDAAGATVFPQPIAMAATFDRRLVRRVASAVGDELRAYSNEAERRGGGPRLTSCFAPNINIFRDGRWGRGSETYGEDPLLTAELAAAFVRGLQGGHHRYLKAAATCKHFAAYSLEEWEGESRFSFNAELDPRDARDTYLPAFEACTAAAAATMCSYNAVNGTPACASPWLLRDQLRGRMGFRGLVVSDCGAIDSIVDSLEWAPTRARAAAAALRAGTDLACLDYSALRQSLEQGLVSERDIDTALRRLLLARFKLGHFDTGSPYRSIPPSVIGSSKHLALAREAAAASFVLLKNDAPQPGAPGAATAQPMLPLRLGGLRRIAVLGPLANRSEYMLGSYYGRPAATAPLLSPFEALQQRVAAHNRRLHAAGGSSAGGGIELELVTGTEVMGQPVNTEGAVAACRRADVCLLFLGTTAASGGPVQERRRYGALPAFSPVVEAEGMDRLDLRLPGHQLHLAQAVAKRCSTPLAVVLVHGAPLDVEWLQASPRVASIMSIWTPGQATAAVADVLLGHASPSGRLPVTFTFNNYTAQAEFTSMAMRRWPGRTHRFLQVPVLYPFGHGLSYTSFDYSPLAAAPAAPADPDGPAGGGGCQRRHHRPLLSVTLNVTNAGGMAGGHAVLLMLSYSGPSTLQQQTAAWLRRWLPGAGGLSSASAVQVVPVDLPCTPLTSAVGGRPGEPELPLQALVGFERVQLAPGEAAQVGFLLTARSFQPFSPLAEGDLGTAVSSRSSGSGPGGCSPLPRPYCGTYLLRACGSELALQLGAAGGGCLSAS